jgi:hypothetical protein
MLQKNNVEFIVDTSSKAEEELEEAYTFVNHSRFPKADNAGNKVRMITQLFDYFRKKYPKKRI